MNEARLNRSYVIAAVVFTLLLATQSGVAAETGKIVKGQLSKEQPILVKEFAIDDAFFKGSGLKKEEKIEAAKRSMPIQLATELVLELNEAGFEAMLYSKETDLENVVILDGTFQSFSGGSTAARVIVGFGTGRSKAKVHVRAFRADSPEETLVEGDVKGKAGHWSGSDRKNIDRASAFKRLANHIVDILEGR